jgi:hypothetical protein
VFDFFFLFCIAGVLSQSTNDPCNPSLYDPSWENWDLTWTPVAYNEWGYDHVNEVRTGETTPTPCGFRIAQVQDDNDPAVCLSVPGVQQTNVQLLLESQTPGVRLCARTVQPVGTPNHVGALEPTCSEGRLRVCFPSESSFYSNDALQF